MTTTATHEQSAEEQSPVMEALTGRVEEDRGARPALVARRLALTNRRRPTNGAMTALLQSVLGVTAVLALGAAAGSVVPVEESLAVAAGAVAGGWLTRLLAFERGALMATGLVIGLALASALHDLSGAVRECSLWTWLAAGVLGAGLLSADR